LRAGNKTLDRPMWPSMEQVWAGEWHSCTPKLRCTCVNKFHQDQGQAADEKTLSREYRL
jgi:hypothetical protein